MIIVSPAKRQDRSCVRRASESPQGLAHTQVLLKCLSGMELSALTQVLGVSERIASEAWTQYQQLATTGFVDDQAIAAIDLYQGDVYKHLAVATLDQSDLSYLQNNLRILSAFYGLLKPLDGIWPYRLEMTTRLDAYPSLAVFWQQWIQAQIANEAPEYIFNLASVAYRASVIPPPSCLWVDVVFQEQDKSGCFRVVAVNAKRMRGKMLRYMVVNRVSHPEQLLGFGQDNYVFNERLSTPSRLVFRRS